MASRRIDPGAIHQTADLVIAVGRQQKKIGVAVILRPEHEPTGGGFGLADIERGHRHANIGIVEQEGVIERLVAALTVGLDCGRAVLDGEIFVLRAPRRVGGCEVLGEQHLVALAGETRLHI
jgi:hypothetical protein